MALARIITRSHPCSRELALDLLARGYAVEIVSPDAIPDNIADLELRVDTGPGDQLIASVETHDGERSASLDFLHHLKAPMVDFRRRPPDQPELGRAVYFPEQPVSFNAEPSIEDVEIPADAPQMTPAGVALAADIRLDPDTEEGARLISPPEQLPSPPVEPPSYFAVAAPTIARPTMTRPQLDQPRQTPHSRDRYAGWRWRAALTFASVVLLAVVLGFGIRRTGKAAAPSSGAVPAEKVAAASTDMNLVSAADSERDAGQVPGQVSVLATPPAMNPDRNSGHAPKESPVAKAGAATVRPSSDGPRSRISRRHGDDLVARDTVTYLDKGFEQRVSQRHAPKAKPAKQLARRHPKSRRHDAGVIAANSVTYLNKPAPKAAK